MKYFIGVDIGGTKTAVVLGCEGPELFAKAQLKTRNFSTPEKGIEEIAAIIGRVLQERNIPHSQIQSVGVSCGGPLDIDRGLILSPPNLPGWDRTPIVSMLRESLGIPVYLQNDANAGALAEWRWGAGKGCRNIIFLTFGTGLGAGLIVNGQLYTGANDMAGEVGHIRLAEFGPAGYGKIGTLEGFASGGGIAQVAKTVILSKFQAGKSVGFCPTVGTLEGINAEIGRAHV